MDQALDQSHNKIAKGKEGNIGITTQKETVGNSNLIKHKKMQQNTMELFIIFVGC